MINLFKPNLDVTRFNTITALKKFSKILNKRNRSHVLSILLADTTVFHNLCSNIHSFCELATAFPDDQDRLMMHLLNTPGEFDRIVRQTRDFVTLGIEMPSQFEKCVDYLLKHPDKFSSIITDVYLVGFGMLAKRKSQLKPIAGKFIRYIIDNSDQFVRIVQTASIFSSILCEFPDQVDLLIRHVVLNEQEFLRLTQDPYDCEGIRNTLRRIPGMSEHYDALFAANSLLESKELRAQLAREDSKKTVLASAKWLILLGKRDPNLKLPFDLVQKISVETRHKDVQTLEAANKVFKLR